MSDAFWHGRSVLVSGASGLLGRWLVPALTARGARVVALERHGSYQGEAPGQHAVSTEKGDIRNLDGIRRIIDDHAIDEIFHLAGQTLVGAARQNPVETLDVNVRGTWTMLEAARVTRGCRVIVASSSKAYGDTAKPPYHEDTPLRGREPYDVSKSCADLIATMYAASYGLPAVTVRCGNVFGGGDSNFSRTIPGAIAAALTGQRFVIRGDGNDVRDFLYVEDAVSAYLKVAEQLNQEPSLRGEAFNFALEQRFTILEVARMVLRLVGRTDLEPVVLGSAGNGIREEVLNTGKARRLLNWSPRFAMEEGLRLSVGWYRDHRDHLKTTEAAAAC